MHSIVIQFQVMLKVFRDCLIVDSTQLFVGRQLNDNHFWSVSENKL